MLFAEEFGIPTRKVYSEDLCPDHCNVIVLGDAIAWAENAAAISCLWKQQAYVCGVPLISRMRWGLWCLKQAGRMNLPRKIGPMLSLADVAVVTKIDIVSQAEREVFRANINDAASKVLVIETDALHGINIDHVVRQIDIAPEYTTPSLLRGNPPVGTCTICVGKRDIGKEAHFGVLRPLESDIFYRGE